MNQQNRSHNRKAAGLTIVELVVASAITAMLIVSIAVAMHASLENYSVNQRIANGTHVSRRVLNTIAETVRNAISIDFESSSAVLSIIPDESTGLELIEYELIGKILYYRETPIGGEQTSNILIGATGDDVTVEAFSVQKEQGLDCEGESCTTRVIISLSLDIQGLPMNMRASASPRKNQIY